MSDNKIDTRLLEEEIQGMKDRIYRESNANDFYYTRGTYKEDAKYLAELERALRDIKENSDIPNVSRR